MSCSAGSAASNRVASCRLRARVRIRVRVVVRVRIRVSDRDGVRARMVSDRDGVRVRMRAASCRLSRAPEPF